MRIVGVTVQHAVTTKSKTLMSAEQEVEQIRRDPTRSYWLKEAVEKLCERDVLDAYHDASALYLVMARRWEERNGRDRSVRAALCHIVAGATRGAR